MYNIWNYNYIQQHAQQQYHQNQVFQVADTARKLQDFLDSADMIHSRHYGCGLELTVTLGVATLESGNIST